jgi:NADP-dependent 3-hydroxy acid dehydrogenase YdfG
MFWTATARLSTAPALRDQTAVVTGASAGVGRAVAIRLGRAGARVGLIARDAEALDSVRAEIESLGGRALALPADVADCPALLAAAQRCESELGPIAIWVNDAMVTVFSPVANIEPEEFRRVTEVTYLGAVHGTMAALRHMRPRNAGTIVQIGSALAYRGIPLQAAYCGAKHAIRGFTDSLRAELLHEQSRIRLTAVELPAVNTPQFDWARTHMAQQPRPMAPVYQPEAIAEKVLIAIRRPVREYWLGASTLATILGNILAPGPFDRFLAGAAVQGQRRPAPVSPDREDNLFRPVRGLHRERGSFGREAHSHLLAVPGPLARAGVVALLAGAAFGLGYLAARSNGRRLPVRTALRLPSRKRSSPTPMRLLLGRR